MFVENTTGAGRPVCLAKLSQPSRDAIIEQGVWSHLQALPEIRAVVFGDDGVKGGDSDAQIDLVAVDQFLTKYPNCCRIATPGEGMGRVRKTVDLLLGREAVYVSVVNPTLKSEAGNQIYQSGYRVDACSNNLDRK